MKNNLDIQLFDTDLVNAAKDIFLSRNETIAVAESVTSGLLQAALSTGMDAAKFYQGGITAYNLGQKALHLRVEPIHAMSCNCVSEKIASEMATNVCTLFASYWGIGITGYASPVPESGNELFAWYAIAYRDKIEIVEKIISPGEMPLKVQLFYIDKILKSLNSRLASF